MVDRVISSILTEHLPYELDMLDRAFEFLHADKYTDLRQPGFFRNAAIEAFWLHARNLIEFLTHPKNSGPQGTVSARDFTSGFNPDMKMRVMDQRINAWVSHLLYNRESQPEERLDGYDMLRVREAIDREMQQFQKHLLPDYEAIWTARNSRALFRSLISPAAHHRRPQFPLWLPLDSIQRRANEKRPA